MRLRLTFLIVLAGTAFSVQGQQHAPVKDTVLKGTTIEVLQAYKPQVKQAHKPEWVPQLPAPDTSHHIENYNDVPQQSLYFTYTSLPLRPLALGKDDNIRPFPNYVKLGAGNLNTIYLDAGIGGIYDKDYETGIHIHHLSQKGSIINQQSSLSGIEAEGVMHKQTFDWHGAINAERNQYSDYGYRHDLYKYSSDTVKQVYTTIRAIADMKNKGDSTDQFLYHPSVNGSVFMAKPNSTETNFGFEVPLTYKLENAIQLHVNVSGSFANLKTDLGSYSNNYLGIQPGLSFDNNIFKGHLLIDFIAGKDSKNYVLPDLLVKYKLPQKGSAIFAGMHSDFRQNTYEQLANDNPYLYSLSGGGFHIVQSRSNEFFAGIEGGTHDHFSYSGRLSYWLYKNLPTYLNDFGDQKQFYVLFDSSVSALSLQLAVRYKEATKWSAGITGDFRHFSNGTYAYAFGIPSSKITGDFVIKPLPKLTITAYLSLQGGIYSRDISGHNNMLKTFADLGGNAEYQIIQRLSAFLQINNIFNDKYQRWLGYQAYGINIYGGLRLKF